MYLSAYHNISVHKVSPDFFMQMLSILIFFTPGIFDVLRGDMNAH